MRVRTSVYIATSLDGFIARANGDLDWLTASDGGTAASDYGYQEFIDSVDVIVMGRHTFEKALTFDHWPYSGKKVVVLSSRPVPIPQPLAAEVEALSLAPHDLVARLSARGCSHLYIDGGKTIQRFLNAGLIDQLIITSIPILLGDGIPLFGALDHDIQLTHIETQQFENGFVQSRYTITDAV